MNYKIDKSDRPLYLRLYELIREDVISGTYPHGTKLPSKRVLAEETGLSTVTVEHAYALLCDEGYAEARERSGYVVIFTRDAGFAAAPKKQALPHASSDRSSSPSFPFSALARAMRKTMTEYGDELLQTSPNAGREELRLAIRQYLARNRGIFVEPRQIIIGSGAEYLYGLIIRLLGKDRIYAIEYPSYEKIEQVYRTEGARCELLPLGESGIESEALAATGASVLHTTPYRSYPSGVSASATKRHEYIRWSREREGRYIIEDDFESEFSVFSKPTEALYSLSEGENVIYLNTFSKTISPSLRVGYMVLPAGLVEPFEQRLGFYSCTVPTFEQIVLAKIINEGDLERHINRVRRRARREKGQ